MVYNSYKQLEDLAKFFALQNDGFRRAYDVASKANVLAQVNSLMSQKAYWQKAAILIATGALCFSSMEEKHKALNECHRQTNECDRELDKLIMDNAISKAAEWYSYRYK